MSSIEQYGRFIDEDACFELTNEPPRKWNNLHYNKIGDDEIYSEISNIGDGPTWCRDDKGRKCELVSHDAKYLYIRDDESGTVFCPWGVPAPQSVEDRSCKYYAAKTVISGTCEGLKATERVFVPRDHVLEAWRLFLENKTGRTRKVSVFAYAMFQLTGCDEEGNPVSKDNIAEVHPEIGGVFVTNRNTFVPTDKFKGYLVTLNGLFAANGYRDHFLRSDFSASTPRILWGWNCDNRPGFGPDCAGVVQVKLEIPPNAAARADFMLGQASSVDQVRQIRNSLSSKRLDELCAEQEQEETKRSAAFRVDTGHPNYDALMNHFVKKQLYSYLINKSGFRDNLQLDCALAMVDYDVAKDNFLRALASQYADGSVPHGFRPLNRLQYADKPAWIFLTLSELIKESGDFSLLEEEVPYLDTGEFGPVWDHAVRTMRHLAGDLGGNGLCDQHHADWNDGLEATREAGARESVMVTEQLSYGLREMAELAGRTARAEIKDEAEVLYNSFKARLNDVAWDGEWYARTICGDGYRIGSKENAEGKIFLNTQSWAVISGIADDERARMCMGSVDKHIETDMGFRICNPGFSKYDPRVGRMSNGIPDHIENGGCYNHAAGFKGVADCMLGRAEEAWRTFVKVAPDNPSNPVSVSGTEPFSFTNSYSMCKHIYGQAGYPWRTGTAAWFTVLLVEWILGARRSYDGLLIDPCLPKAIPRAHVRRAFRSAVYEIDIDNTAGRGRGVSSVSVDGEAIKGNVLPPLEGGVHNVKVVVG